MVDRSSMPGSRWTHHLWIGCVTSALVLSTTASATAQMTLQTDENVRHNDSIFDVAPSVRRPVSLHGFATGAQPGRGKFFYLLS